jgi:hypothetical protein
MGMMKAKLIKKYEDAGVLPSGTLASLLSSFGDRDKTDSIKAEMSSATKDLVAVLMTSTTALKRDDLRMRQHDKWMKVASFHVSIGKRDRALALMAKIEQSKSAGHSTPNKEPENERDDGKEYAYLSNKHTPPPTILAKWMTLTLKLLVQTRMLVKGMTTTSK